MTKPDSEDVATAVRFAVEHDLPLSVKGGGHHVAGSAIVEAGVVIDLSGMNAVTLDEQRGRVLVQGGAKLGDLDRGTLPFGYLTLSGIDHDTGVGGLTVGGGVGWTMRRHGLTCDNVTAVTIVTADGQVQRADDESDPDLMWSLRGGGGNFGIVTEFEFEAHPVAPAVLAGFAVYDSEDAARILREYRSIAADAPDDLTTIVFLRIAPPVPWMPTEAVASPS
jgi:FAD/FMN-containing dehydrogenase